MKCYHKNRKLLFFCCTGVRFVIKSVYEEVIVLQGGSLPDLQKKGGGADENVFVSGFAPVCDVFNYTACLHR